ncbi:signal recognition particle-docking protein FtsY [bacterium]|nr:signal recognition particle-docking protein FtsY [bacterium]
MFGFIKNKLKKIYDTFTTKVHALFSKTTVDPETLKELETILIGADVGVKTTRTIITNLKKKYEQGQIAKGSDLKNALEQELHNLLSAQPFEQKSNIFLLVGINGSGKTTFAAKLASKLQSEGKKVLLVAADTFRAAAVEQLTTWAKKLNIAIESGTQGQDPASVVFKACETFKQKQFDALIIDTAGRLQTKTNLMKELEKIKRIISKQLPENTINTLLTVDSMLGQNSLEQARIFNQSTDLSGIILTKMDGTAKGGIVFAIVQELNIPVAYISFGEQTDQFKNFAPQEYVQQLLEE